MPNDRSAPSGWRINEAVRQQAIDELDLVRLRESGQLDRITDFAAKLFDAPIALVSVVERDRQFFPGGTPSGGAYLSDAPRGLVWWVARPRQFFPGKTGLEDDETPREVSFCQHAMLGTEIMVVPDATRDDRFADNALVTGDPNIRFYAGAPLVSAEGVPLGALCIIDSAPRAGMTDLQRQGLTVLADGVMALFRANRN